MIGRLPAAAVACCRGDSGRAGTGAVPRRPTGASGVAGAGG